MKEKLIEVRDLLKGHVLALIIILVIVIGIPVTVYLAKQQQNLRSRATEGEAGSLVFIPSSGGTVNKDSVFNLDFGINFTSANRATGVDITITYTNNLSLENFAKDTTVLPEEVLDSRDPVSTPRTVRYVAVNKTGDLFPVSFVPLGKLTFKAIGDGQATITIADKQIVAKDQPAVLDVGDTSTTYTIEGSPPPSVPPPPPPTACINGDTIGGDGLVDINDYKIWEAEFTGAKSTKTADFYPECRDDGSKGDGIIDIRDYNIWRREMDELKE